MAFPLRLNTQIRAIVPAACFALYGLNSNEKQKKNVGMHCSCSALQPEKKDTRELLSNKSATSGMMNKNNGDSKEEIFHGIFPARQVWKSKMPHPALWDNDWDDLKPVGNVDQRQIRKEGVTKHIILIRHGQYDEAHREDEKRILTPLGREQADKTGIRLAEIVKGIEEDERFGPCNIKVVRVSNLARAKETADIIAKHLPGIERSEPDPLLNEGRPCHNIPCGQVRESTIEKVDETHPRIEEAFRKYFYRAPLPILSDDSTNNKSISLKEDELQKDTKGHSKHEFEIIVCHANLIRYFFCRALQLPPEAWLRLCTFNCSLTYFTVRPTGTVSCRMLGDIGHLGYDKSTFSMHHGFNW